MHVYARVCVCVHLCVYVSFVGRDTTDVPYVTTHSTSETEDTQVLHCRNPPCVKIRNDTFYFGKF